MSIAREMNIVEVLPLLCSAFETAHGLKPEQFNYLRHLILQTYGCELLFTLHSLRKLRPLGRHKARNPFVALCQGPRSHR